MSLMHWLRGGDCHEYDSDYDIEEVRRRLAALETRVEAIEAGARGARDSDD